MQSSPWVTFESPPAQDCGVRYPPSPSPPPPPPPPPLPPLPSPLPPGSDPYPIPRGGVQVHMP